ncbi:MAG: RNA polymerase subunit sigma-70 [Planctomycetia bacterium]|nr:RNA polymerase subunit sigma-70 [Planctomycetia bacterium]
MKQDSTDSIVELLAIVRQGHDESAEQELWNRYFDQLLVLAKQHLQSRARRIRDEEDIALSVLDSFFRGAAVGRFTQLNDRNDLWIILRMLTKRKTIDHLRREHAIKRGGDIVRGESVFMQLHDSTSGSPDIMPGKDIEPELAAMFTEECDRLFATLRDEALVKVALLKLEGFTNEEIAHQLYLSERSIERKLKTIRAIWLQQVKEDASE